MSENNYGQEPGKNNEYVPGQYSSNGSTSAQDGNWAQQGQNEQYQAGNNPANTYQQYGASVQKPAGHGLGIAALVLGIISLLTCWFFGLGALVGLVGLILGIVAIVKLKKTPNSKKGMAITGLVLSILGLIAGGFFLAMTVVFGGLMGDAMEECGHLADDEAKLEQCLNDWSERL